MLAAPSLTLRCNFARKKALEDLVVSYAPTAGYWRFSESNGTIAFDRLAGNHGTYNGGVTVGTAGLVFEDPATDVKLNGTTGYVKILDAASLHVGDTISIFGTNQLAALGVKQYLAWAGNGAWAVYVDVDNKLKLEKPGTGLICLSTATWDLASHDWLITKTGAAVVIYIDGLEVTGVITNQTLGNSGDIYVGQNGSAANFSSATFGDFAIDSTVWTSTQASALHIAFATGEFGGSIDSVAARRTESGKRRRGFNADRSSAQVGELTLVMSNTDKFLTERRNHAPNPSMEFGLHGLNISAVTSIGAAASSLAWRKDPATGGGTYCGEVSLSATLNSLVWFAIEGVWPANQPVTVSVPVKNVSGNTNIQVGIASSGTPADIAVSAGVITGAYAAKSATLVPTGDRTDLIGFIRTSTAAAAVVRFDEIQVNGGAAAVTYVEGPTWPMLQDALPVHAFATYLGTDYPLFFGYAQRLTPTPDDQRVTLVVNDPLKNLNQPVDVSVTMGGTHYTLRLAILDAAFRRVQQTAGGAENLCCNGSFETNQNQWTGGTRDNTDAYVGTWSLKVTGQAIYTAPPFLRALMVPDRVYTASFRAKRATASAETATFAFGDVFGQATGYASITTGTGLVPALSAAWQQFSVSWVYSGSANAGSLSVLSGSMDPAKGVRIDAVMITEGYVAPTSYVDFAAPVGRLRNWAMPWSSVEGSAMWAPGWSNRCGNPEALVDTTGWTKLAGPYFSTNNGGPGELTTDWKDNDAQVYATAGVAFANNVGYLLDVENSHATNAAALTGVTGGGLTWVSMGTVQFSGTTRRATRFRALVTAGAVTAALTITVSGTNNTGCGWALYAFGGVPTGGTNGSLAFGAAVTATGANTSAVSVTAAAAASAGHMMLATVFADAGVTIAPAAPYGGMNRKSGTAPAGSIQGQWCDFPQVKAQATLSAAANWAAITCEIKGAAGGTLNRVTKNPIAGTPLVNGYGTGLSLSGASGASAIYATTGTYLANHTYTGSVWVSELVGSGVAYKVAAVSLAGGDVGMTTITGPVSGGGATYSGGITGSIADANSGFVVWSTGTGTRIWFTFTPTADRTDVSFVIRASSSNSLSSAITFSGVMLNPGGLMPYARTGLAAPSALDEPATLTTVADGISHSHCVQFTTKAVAGSGVTMPVITGLSPFTGLQPMVGVTITAVFSAKAAAGAPVMAFGLANPWGVAAVDSASATYTLSNAFQRFYVKLTPARTDFTFGDFLVFTAMITTATAATIEIEDLSVTIGTAIQPFIAPEIAGVDTAETDLLPAYAAQQVEAIATLDNLNGANLGVHYIAYQRYRPYYRYTSVSRKTLVTKPVTQTWSETFAKVLNLQKDRDSTAQVVVAQYNPASIMPGSGAAATPSAVVSATASATVLARTAGAPRVATVGSTEFTNGPAGANTDAQDIANYQLARFASSPMRPQIQRTNDWAVILATNPTDVVAWTFAKHAIAGMPLLLLAQEDDIGRGLANWTSTYDTEELRRA